MNVKQAVVIGAGPGGLAAAMQLAKAGMQVTLLESKATVGGRCASLRMNGFRFDIGPTFFLYPRVLDEIFASVGYSLTEEVPMRKLDPQYRISFGAGGKLDCTPNLDLMSQRMGELSPKDRGSLGRFMDDNRRKLARFRPILENPFSSPFDLLRPSVLKAAHLVRPWRSLHHELSRYFSDPRLQIAFSFQSKYLGMSPFQCPSLFSILSFLEYEHGVFHPIGGCGQVSERMAELAKEMGVDVRTEEPVEFLEFQGRRVTSVHTKKGKYPSHALVINADFANTMNRLVPNSLRRRWSDEKLEKKLYSCSTYMMYLGIRGKYEQLPHHNIHIAVDYERNLREIESDGVLPQDPSFYVQNPSVTDTTLAPEGHSGLYVLVPVPNLLKSKFRWDAQTRDHYRQLTLQQLKKIGLEDVEERICSEKVICPQDWYDDFGVYAGATFNLSHTLGQMLHKRPNNRFEELDGVYLVGGGTHPGSGLPVIYESSRIASRQLLADLGISSRFMQTSACPTPLPT